MYEKQNMSDQERMKAIREWEQIRKRITASTTKPSPCRKCIWADVTSGKILCSRNCKKMRCFSHK